MGQNVGALTFDGWRVSEFIEGVTRPVSAEEFWTRVESGIWSCDLNLQGIADISVRYFEQHGALRAEFIANSEKGPVPLPADFEGDQDSFVSGVDWIPLRSSSVRALKAAIVEYDLHSDRDLDAKTFFDSFTHFRVGGLEIVLPDDLGQALQNATAAFTPGLAGKPFSYQRVGIKWLCDYFDCGLGTILADEMGLGKTFQILGLVAHATALSDRPVLIVCPSTLLVNWLREFQQFLPGSGPYLHHGPLRTRRMELIVEQHPIVLTTYSLLVNDFSEFSRVRWSLVICDEAQAVKNRKSKSRRAVKGLRADVKSLVTGTPFENSLKDVWSLVDIVHEGLLGDAASFEREVLDVPGHAKNLSHAVGPLILRRRVTEVMKDLPPLIEIDVPLSPSQALAEVYEVRRLQGVNRRPSEGFLELSGALRRICASVTAFDSALYDPEDAKYLRLFEILDELNAVDEDGVLIFSNWVDSIKLLVSRLGDRYGADRVASMWGETTERQELVDEFNEFRGFRLMVVNPEVGGVGLNITGASHVVHYDRLWNPMLEKQATARAWRRGQTKTVFVHKFFYEGTIEDVVQQRLEMKKSLSEKLLSNSLAEEEEAMQARAQLISPVAFNQKEGEK